MKTSIDNMIRVDNAAGTDFTLVDRNEFYSSMNDLFTKAERTRYSLESLSQGSLRKEHFEKFNEMENILSYRNKSEDEQKKLYYNVLISNPKKDVFFIDCESMRDK